MVALVLPNRTLMHNPFLLSPSRIYQSHESFKLRRKICTFQHALISLQVILTWLLLTMETEIQELQILGSPRIPRNHAIGRELEIINEKWQYTSLKDIIYNSPTRCSILYEGNEFDSSNISIRNELVKRAASYYLQSAVFLPSRNPNYFVVFWEKLKSKAASCPCWRGFAGNPIRACLWPIFQFLNHIVGSTRSLFDGV